MEVSLDTDVTINLGSLACVYPDLEILEGIFTIVG